MPSRTWPADLEGIRPAGRNPCREAPEATLALVPALAQVARDDARVDEWFATAANAWRAAGSLHTSQFVVVLVPA